MKALSGGFATLTNLVQSILRGYSVPSSIIGVLGGPRTDRSLLSRYLLAFVVVLVTAVVLVVLSPLFGDGIVIILGFPAVAISAWYGGFGPGVAATVLTSIVFVIWDLFGVVPDTTFSEAIRLSFFLAMGFTLSVLFESLKIALHYTSTELLSARVQVRALLDLSVSYLLVVDRSGRVIDANETLLRAMGCEKQGIVGAYMWDLKAGISFRGEHFRGLLERARRGTEASGEATLVLYTGEDTTVQYVIRPIRDDQNQVALLMIEGQDIQRTKDLERALHASEELFRGIIDTMPQLVWSSRPDGFVDYCNVQWLEYTGLTESDIKGGGWSVALHSEDREVVFELWADAIRRGHKYAANHRLKRRDGEYRWFLSRANPLRSGSGAIIKWYGTCTDIHEQKLAETELRAEARRKDDFIALLAHELRNPLAPIRTCAKVLKLQVVDGPVVTRCLDIIERQLGTMTRLLEDLLDISRINRGVIQLKTERVRLLDVLRASIETMRSSTDQSQQEVELHAPSEEILVEGDAVRLEQVFVNLLSNSAKYSDGPGRIVISVEPSDDSVSVTIKDTGIGISAELLPRVFEAFVQGTPSVERKAGGLGIGLNLTRSLVHLHHGDIVARSEGEGRGSEFEVRLPRIGHESADNPKNGS